jgi:methylenetetrahydrofolate reductase (NADPH)
MYIKELFNKKPVISLEIFPPKPTTPISSVYKTLEDLKDLKPDFISVTYGASGTSKSYTVELADIIKNKYHIEALAHLTCYNSSKDEINSILKQLKEKNIQNILALRGDLPNDCTPQEITNNNLEHASSLVRHINSYGGFSIGGACYPEGHIECSSTLDDLKNLKAKVSHGVDFLITQLFFDNDIFYNFKEKLDILGITVPISAGIMPVINKKQIERITSMCGATLTPKFKRIVNKYEFNPEALTEAGIAYATEQIIDLLSFGVDGIHLYTMNRSDVALKIINDISNIRECFAI